MGGRRSGRGRPARRPQPAVSANRALSRRRSLPDSADANLAAVNVAGRRRSRELRSFGSPRPARSLTGRKRSPQVPLGSELRRSKPDRTLRSSRGLEEDLNPPQTAIKNSALALAPLSQ